MAQTFIARRNGRCTNPDCERPILAGDAVIYVDRDLVHDECALAVAPPELTDRSICPECFTQRAVNGACAC